MKIFFLNFFFHFVLHLSKHLLLLNVKHFVNFDYMSFTIVFICLELTLGLDIFYWWLGQICFFYRLLIDRYLLNYSKRE